MMDKLPKIVIELLRHVAADPVFDEQTGEEQDVYFHALPDGIRNIDALTAAVGRGLIAVERHGRRIDADAEDVHVIALAALMRRWKHPAGPLLHLSPTGLGRAVLAEIALRKKARRKDLSETDNCRQILLAMWNAGATSPRRAVARAEVIRKAMGHGGEVSSYSRSFQSLRTGELIAKNKRGKRWFTYLTELGIESAKNQST